MTRARRIPDSAVNPTADPPTPDWARFGARVRAAREGLELSLRDAALRCRLRSEELAGFEAGKEAPRRSVVAELDEALGARGVLLDAWARGHITGLLEGGADLGDACIQAHRVWAYAPLMVPECFQDHDYAQALRRCEPSRRGPKQVSIPPDTTGAPTWGLLLDETALYRRVGGVEAMRGQLERLLAYAASARVAVHVIPAATGRHPGLRGGLWIITYSAHHRLAYQPSAHGPGHLAADAEAVQGYSDALAALQLAALPAPDSADLLRRALAALDTPTAPKALTTGTPATTAPAEAALDGRTPARTRAH